MHSLLEDQCWWRCGQIIALFWMPLIHFCCPSAIPQLSAPGGFCYAWEKLVIQSHSCCFESSSALMLLTFLVPSWVPPLPSTLLNHVEVIWPLCCLNLHPRLDSVCQTSWNELLLGGGCWSSGDPMNTSVTDGVRCFNLLLCSDNLRLTWPLAVMWSL